MHDVDVHLILIVYLIQNQLVFIKSQSILRFMELCIVKHKVTTNNGNSCIIFWGNCDTEDFRTKEKCFVFSGLCIMLKFNHGVF